MEGDATDSVSHESMSHESKPQETLPWLGTLLGIAAGAGAALEAFLVASSALAHRADALALQRGLLAYHDNSGGPWLDPQLERLAPNILVAYTFAGISLVVSCGFAWYGGRIVAQLGGDSGAVAGVGRRVAWLSWLFWAVTTILTVLVLRADASVSWLVASGIKLSTPAGKTVTGLFVDAPDAAFVGLQLAALLLQLGIGLGIGLYCCGVAATRGARGTLPLPPATE